MTTTPNSTIMERLRPVSSRQNARVKELRRLFHEAAPNENGEVAIEGLHLVEEAIRSGLRVPVVLFSASATDRAHKLLPQLSHRTETLVVPDDVFAGAVPSETPQGVAALVQIHKTKLEDVMRVRPSLLVIAAGLQDPGNLGTIARSAEAFGATGLLLAERTVSPWNWKAVRASAGSLFRLPLAKVGSPAEIGELKTRGVRVLATSSHKGSPIAEVDLRGDIALIVGNEGAGIPKAILAQADGVVMIPQSSRVESLNAAIAASIMLYEAFRQRNAAQP